MKFRGLPILAVAAALALAPAAAVAASGDDQYCDPFGGCGGSTTTTTPSKPHRPSGGGQSHGTGHGGSQADQSANPMASGLIGAIQQQTPAQIERKIRESSADPIAAAIFEKALLELKANRARAVLDAAGLSALEVVLRAQ